MGIRISKQVAWYLPKKGIDIDYILELVNEENMNLKEFLSYKEAKAKFLDMFIHSSEKEYDSLKISDFIDFFENENEQIRGVLFKTIYKDHCRYDDSIDYIEETMHKESIKNSFVFIKNTQIPPFFPKYVISESGIDIPSDLELLARSFCGKKNLNPSKAPENISKLGLDLSKEFHEQVHIRPPEFFIFLGEILKIKKTQSIKMKPVIAKQWR